MVTGAHGLKGAVWARPFSEHPADWWRDREGFFLALPGGQPEPRPRDAARLEVTPKGLRVTLAGVKDRNGAEELRGAHLLVPEADLPPLGEEEVYLDDLFESLRGSRIHDESGAVLATVADVMENPVHPILEVEKEGGVRSMVPLVRAFFRDIEPLDGVLVVTDPEWFHAL